MVIFYCGELIRAEKESARRQMGGGEGGGGGVVSDTTSHYTTQVVHAFLHTYACLPRSKYTKINKISRLVWYCVAGVLLSRTLSNG